MPTTLNDLGILCGCQVEGDPDTVILRASSIQSAMPGSLVFALDVISLRMAEESAASAILAAENLPAARKSSLRAPNVRLAWARILETLHPPAAPAPGVHPSSIVHPTAAISETAVVGPHCAIGAGTRIGERCVLGPGVVLGDRVEIDEDSVLHAHVVIGDDCRIGKRNLIHPSAVVGADGFGFARDGQRYHRIPQIGRVVTGCDVEIGANATIDRAALDETIIGDGVKIDNLVQVGHNSTVGAHTIIAAQAGISGSVTVSEGVVMGGQAGIADHLTIGRGAVLAGRAGVTGNVAPGEVVMGFPARPRREFLRSAAALAKLPSLLKTLRSQASEGRAEALERSPSSAPSGSPEEVLHP